ncbi:hypothetical protein XA68_11111 [Ophiocordyceps unilateralis]|uniref:Uncharacterized protein n=1 Tax=Ophiocordyceps unilateralis TaxID=268505 RepID=A0A2A9PGJ6_OPHUN|nr:hypothetical protein XA68_11111 [Ophiocordyceps unilateralis]
MLKQRRRAAGPRLERGRGAAGARQQPPRAKPACLPAYLPTYHVQPPRSFPLARASSYARQDPGRQVHLRIRKELSSIIRGRQVRVRTSTAASDQAASHSAASHRLRPVRG